MYSEKVMRLFSNPRNVGSIESPDGYGYGEDSAQGTVIEIFLQVKRGRILDIKFRTFGCVAAIAISVMITTMAKGKMLDKAASISHIDVINKLDGLPPAKAHSCELAVKVLREAINDYRKKS